MPAIKAKFYDLSKRNNSTKRPASEDEFIDYDIVFKRPTDIMNPDILLDTAGVYPDFVYCVIEIPLPEVGEEVVKTLYYFVTNITVTNNNIFELHLKLDSLATAKDDILASTAYVQYSTNDFDRWIRDDRVPITPWTEVVGTSSALIDVASGEQIFEASDDEDVVLTTVSQETGITYWCMTESRMNQLMDYLTQAGATIWGSLVLQFGDAMGSVIQATRLPVKHAAMPLSGNVADVWLGDYHVQDPTGYFQAYQLDSKVIISKGAVSIPAGYLDFRCNEPYSILKASIPFVGVVDLNFSDFRHTGDASINYRMVLDLIEGVITWTLTANYDDETVPVATYSGKCGGNIPVANTQIQNASAIVSSLATGTAQLAMAAVNPASAVTGIASLAAGFYAAQQKTTNVIGAYSGGRSEYSNIRFRVIYEKYRTAIEPENLADYEGRPCLKVRAIDGLTGYCRTQGFQLSGHYIKDIKDEVNALMDSGVYLE